MSVSIALLPILLVEDNPDDAELAIRSLRKHHANVAIKWVKDGAEALDYLFCEGGYAGRDPAEVPGLILLDLKLPKVDGIEVLRRVKQDERIRILPVVVMTSSREECDIVESYRLGVNSYVVKPVDFAEFSKAIGQLGMYWLLLNESPVAHLHVTREQA